MLQSIHDGAKGWIAYVVVFIISVPFAVFGIQEYFGGSDPRVAAEVNGTPIALSDFQNALRDSRETLRRQFGGQLPPGLISDELLKEQALNSLIRKHLYQQEIDQAGYRIGDQQLFERIQELPQFRTEAGFSKTRFEQFLAMQQREKSWFEALYRNDLLVQQFLFGVSDSAFLPRTAREDYLRLKRQTRDFDFFVIKADAYRSQIQPDDQAVQAFYTNQAERYQTPERVKLAYIELDLKQVEKQIKVDEEQLRQVYEQHADQYRSAEQRRVRHILIKLPADASVEAVAAAQAQASALVARLRAGEDFATLAKSNSQDSLSADNGGDLGLLARGDMERVFEDAVFSMAPQFISEPIRTGLGWQIAQVTEIKPSEQQSFETVRATLENEYRRQEAEGMYDDLRERLADASYTQRESLAPAAAQTNLPVQTSEWITRAGGAGIGANTKVREAAFSDEVLKESGNSDMIELGDERVVVVRVLEHQASAPLPLAQVREAIVDELIQQGASDRVRKAGEQALAQIAQGQAVEAVAKGVDVAVQHSGYVDRSSAGMPRAVIEKAFTLATPASAPVYGGTALPNGDYVVIALKAVKPGEFTDKDLESVDQQLSSAYGQSELEAMSQAMKDTADVKVFNDNLE